MKNDYVDLGLRYEEALHGLQSAINFSLEVKGEAQTGCSVKHLRVGIDSLFATNLGLANLLMEKGVFTKEEYMEHMRLAANTELHRYQEMLSNYTGAELTFR